MIATKVHGVMRDEPNGRGLSRKAILFELDQSLSRLGTDYVDLYQIHRWDYETPIDETLEVLHDDVVKAGRGFATSVRVFLMFAWQVCTKALYLADLVECLTLGLFRCRTITTLSSIAKKNGK